MKKVAIALCTCLVFVIGCFPEHRQTSDDIQRDEQERILREGNAQVGMPSIKNFRERKILKDILELRDQEGLVTYVYLDNMIPTVVPGHTAMGGKYTYFGEAIGYGIPYSTQFSNPQKMERYGSSGHWGYHSLPQADPNGLFSPGSSTATWLLMKDPHGKGVEPVYVEQLITVSPFKYDLDKAPVEAK